MSTLLGNAALWPFLAVGAMLLAAFQASLYWATTIAAPSDLGKPSKRWRPKLLMGMVPAALLGLYISEGNPQALLPVDEARYEASMQNSVQQLAQRLRGSPKDDSGWMMLARSQTALGHYDEAANAYEQAKALAWNDPSLLVSWAEVRLLANQRSFDARTREVIGRAAALAPGNPEVLLLIGLEALDRDDRHAARTALEALRAHYPASSPDLEAVESALEALKQGRNPQKVDPTDTETR